MKSWHYLPVYIEDGEQRAYTICEVYLDNEGCVTTWTATRTIAARGASPIELKADLEQMLNDVDRWEPVAFHSLQPGMTLTRKRPATTPGPRSAI